MVLWLQLSSKSCLRVPKLSKSDWRAEGSGMPDPNNGFSMLSLPSSGLVGTHVQMNRWPVSHLCRAGPQNGRSFFVWVGIFPSVRYQSLGELTSHISFLALASLCVCIKWVCWLLLNSEECRSWDTLPALLPAPQNVPACPTKCSCVPLSPVCCCGSSLQCPAGSSQAWGWSRSSSVWGMQHFHHSWLIMCQERQESLTCENH